MAFVLDSDSTSNLITRGRNRDALHNRLQQESPETVYITVVTLHEILRGALPIIDKASGLGNVKLLLMAYDDLLRLYTQLRQFQVLPYDEAADGVFQQIPAKVRQSRKRDCRIAAIAMSRGYTVVTSNTRDFSPIPGLQYEDWNLSTADASE